MLYQFRNPSGSISKDSHGTFVDSDGLCTILRESDFTVAPKRVWVSPRTGVNYPSGWRIGVRSLDLELDVDPCLSDQELDTRKSTMVIYWEGACSVSGSSKNSEVNGNAYVELVGYDQGATGPTFVRFLKSMLGK